MPVSTVLPTSGATGRPEPVLDAAKLAGAVSGIVLSVGTVFVLVGWVTADEVQNWAVIAGGIVMSIGTLLAIVLPIITALGARAQVTPLAAPVSVDGVPLITSVAAPPVAGGPQEFVDELRDLERAPADASTTELPELGSWRPATPAAVAHEPTPIGAEAEAATTGRISGRIPPVPTPSI
jgi:hypothetical protein